MVQGQLLAHAVLALAQRVDPTPYRGYPLANIKIQSLDKGGIDLPAIGSEDLLDRVQRAEYHPVFHHNDPLTSILLDDLRIEQPRQRHSAGLGQWALVLAALGLRPHAKVAQDGRQIPLEPVAQPGGHTTWR